MMRLAVYGETALWTAVALRLHGASIVHIGTDEVPLPPFNDYDAVLIADRSSDGSRVDEVLANGKHALTLAGSTMDLDALGARARSAAVQLAIVNPDRYLPSRDLIRQQFDVGKLGLPGLIRIHRWEARHRTDASRPTLPAPIVNDIDLALWFVGKSPDTVFATESSREATASHDGRTIQVHLGFSDGAMALIDYTNQLPAGDDYQSFSIIGSAGAAYADDHQNVQLLYQGDQPRAVRVEEEVRQWTNLTQDFVDSLRDGKDLSHTLRDWQKAVGVGQAVESSLTTRQAVVQGAA